MYGESVVMRVLDRSVVALDLTKVGMDPATLAKFRTVINIPNGIVLVTGPTYAKRDVFAGDPIGVLIGTPAGLLEQIAGRFHATPAAQRPILMYTFLPHLPQPRPAGSG